VMMGEENPRRVGSPLEAALARWARTTRRGCILQRGQSYSPVIDIPCKIILL